MKRICLFAAYDIHDIIQDYVIYYISELSKISDVYYLSDNEMSDNELSKLDKITTKSFSFKHGKYDFGSWQELINRIGWDEIEKYDQLILANDSCYGPLFDLSSVFSKCESKFDFWGISEGYYVTRHIQSYFLVMNKKVVTMPQLRFFFTSIEKEKRFADIVRKYEITLSQLIKDAGLTIGSYMNNSSSLDPVINSMILIKKYKCPFVKVKLLTGKSPSINTYEKMIKTISIYANYNIYWIEKHILSKNITLFENRKRVFKQLCKNRILGFVRKWLFSVKVTNKNKLLVKIFKIPILKLKIKKARH